jgi:hypothetical protein
MKRLTEYTIPETGFSVVSEEKYKRILMEEKPSVEKVYNRLKKIEDILGDEYDLDGLRELVQANREGRCVVLPIKVPGWGWCCNREYPNAISAYFAYPSQVVDCMEEYILRESKDEAEAALRRGQDG